MREVEDFFSDWDNQDTLERVHNLFIHNDATIATSYSLSRAAIETNSETTWEQLVNSLIRALQPIGDDEQDLLLLYAIAGHYLYGPADVFRFLGEELLSHVVLFEKESFFLVF